MQERKRRKPRHAAGQSNIKGQLESAMAEFKAGNVDVAETRLTAMLEEHRQVPHVHLALAKCSLSSGEHETALEHVQTALSINEELPAAYNLRGEIYTALEEEDMALADFEQAIELNPAMVKAHVNLARHYLEQEETELALEHCETALEYEPHKDSIRLLLCSIHEKSGNSVAAQEEALAAVQANPGSVAAYFKQGMLSFKKQDLLQASKAFEGLLEIRPDSMLGHFLLGVCALGLKQYQLAERSFNKALENIDANDGQSKARESRERIRHQLVLTYLKQGKHSKALVAAKELARESQSKKVLKLLADIYYESGSFELAAQQYRAIALKSSRLTEQHPEITELLDYEGDAKDVADAWREAFSALQQGDKQMDAPALLEVSSL